MGMRVLWFEKRHGLFSDPRVAGMPGAAGDDRGRMICRPLPGGGTGRDQVWRGKTLGLARVGPSPPGAGRRRSREGDRRDAVGGVPALAVRGGRADAGTGRPGDCAVDAAIRHMATAAKTELVILPIEDALGLAGAAEPARAPPRTMPIRTGGGGWMARRPTCSMTRALPPGWPALDEARSRTAHR